MLSWGRNPASAHAHSCVVQTPLIPSIFYLGFNIEANDYSKQISTYFLATGIEWAKVRGQSLGEASWKFRALTALLKVQSENHFLQNQLKSLLIKMNQVSQVQLQTNVIRNSWSRN